jgi:uncharacterized membrane protein
VLLLVGLTVLAHSAPADFYLVRDLGPDVRTVGALDRNGTAYGSANIDGSQQAAQITEEEIVALGTLLDFTRSAAHGDRGRRTVGELSQVGTGRTRAWALTPQGDFRLLETPVGRHEVSVATDTWRREDVGWVIDEASRIRPVVWDRQGRLTFLPTLGEGTMTGGVVEAVNRVGVKVGQCDGEAPGVVHACLWEADGTVRDLHTTSGTFSTATDINDWGGVVGVAAFPEGFHGFLALGGRMIRLPGLPGDQTTDAAVINNRFDICGTSTFSPPPTVGRPPPPVNRAVCWDQHLRPVDLHERIDAPGWELLFPLAINEQGVLAILGRLNGVARLALLHPKGQQIVQNND